MKVLSIDESRKLDELVIKDYKISSEILMENAGLAAYSVIDQEIGSTGKKIFILCAPGNNGGDGLVIARKLLSNGGSPEIFLFGDESKFTGAAETNFNIVKNLGIKITRDIEVSDFDEKINQADAIVDAIFGTGLSREIKGKYADVIEVVNNHNMLVFSVDIPSGINGSSGQIMGKAIKATHTITFGLPKFGHLLYPGACNCGKLHISHISFPPKVYKNIKTQINEPVTIPPRRCAGHKGTFGDVLFIAGSFGYFGAPYLCAESFLKAGGGYARLASTSKVISSLIPKAFEFVFIPSDETKSGSLSLSNKKNLLEIAEKADAVVIGPGISLNEETQILAQELIREIEKPVIIDGDALTAIKDHMDMLKERKAATILTPHLGELSRITKTRKEQLESNLPEILREQSNKYGAIIVSKGAHSLVAYPSGEIFINLSGNSGMATAGSGDVLSGVIAAMMGLGFGVEEAVRMGVFAHGFAGDLAADEIGEDGITASSIMEHLPTAMNNLRKNMKNVKTQYSIEVL